MIDNPELELIGEDRGADAVLIYRFDPQAGVHSRRLMDPVADRLHIRTHKRND